MGEHSPRLLASERNRDASEQGLPTGSRSACNSHFGELEPSGVCKSVSESGECHVDSYEFPQVMVSTYSERGVALFNSVYLLLLILFLKQRQYQWMGEKKE